MINNILLQAQQSPSAMPMLLMMVAIFAIMYFFMIRPQRQQQKEIQKFQNQLAEGTEVVIGGGIHGTVKSVDLAKGTVDVKIARDTVVVVEKSQVFNGQAPAQPQK